MLIAFPVDSNSASHGAPPVSKRDIPTRKAFFVPGAMTQLKRPASCLRRRPRSDTTASIKNSRAAIPRKIW